MPPVANTHTNTHRHEHGHTDTHSRRKETLSNRVTGWDEEKKKKGKGRHKPGE